MTELIESWTTCFWSYVRRDDLSMKGKISHIKEDLIDLYSLETGRTLKIFQDVESIGWGESWEEALGGGISKTLFFVPLVTPNYLKSDACCRELITFHQLCQARGLDGLILPIVISGQGNLSVDHDDEVVRILAKANYIPFSNIWPMARESEGWITGIRELCNKLISAEERVEEALPAILESEIRATGLGFESVDQMADHDGLEAPGLMEVAEQFASTALVSQVAVEAAVRDFNMLASVLEKQGEKVRQVGDNASKYKAAILEMATAVKEPAMRLTGTASEAQRAVLEADSFVKQYRSLLGAHNSSSMLEIRRHFDEQTEGFRSVAAVADDIDGLERMVADAEKISIILRRSLRPARQSLRMLSDAARTVASWAPPTAG